MHTYIFEGTMTALTSISHIGDTHGINAKLRREKIVQPDGSVEEVPIISGNSLRGILRDRGMLHMLKCLGYGVNDATGEVNGLSLAAFYFLFSGGALEKVGSRGLDIDEARKWRDLIPLVALFGGAMGNQIMPGKAKIGKAIPICRETAHLLPERFLPELTDDELVHLIEQIPVDVKPPSHDELAMLLAALVRHDAKTRRRRYFEEKTAAVALDEIDADYLDSVIARWQGKLSFGKYFNLEILDMDALVADVKSALPHALESIGVGKKRIKKIASIWDMCQEEAYTRRDDEKSEGLRQLIAPETRKLLEAKAAGQREKAKTGDDVAGETGQKQQMRYYVETLASGTRLFWDITMDDVTDLEFEAFCVTLAEFSRFPYIGGKSGVGHGKVEIRFDNWMKIDPRIAPTGREISFALGNLYKNHLEQHGAEIRELINGLS